MLSDRLVTPALLRQVFALSLGMAAWSCAGGEPSNAVPVLDSVRVEGAVRALGSDAAAARRALEALPGAASVVPAQAYRQGAVLGLHDALAATPGIYVQNPGGQESGRVSIRGSGLTGSTTTRGLRLLRDGLPLGRGDDLGESIFADPFGADYIEVYRGASSLQYGAATLGGAINLVSPTGYSHPGATVRAEVGSYGYVKGEAKAGQVFDNGMDVFASVSTTRSDGYRDNNAQRVSRFYGNMGFRFSPDSEGRLHIASERYRIQIPGPLSRDQLEDDPSAANAGNSAVGAQIHTAPRWHVAYHHQLLLKSGDRLSLGIFHNGTRFESVGNPLGVRYDAADYGVSLRHELERQWAGHRNRLVWGANFTHGRSDDGGYWPRGLPPMPRLPPPGSRVASIQGERRQWEAFAENTLYVTDHVAVVAGMQATWASRRSHNAVLPLIAALYPDGDASRRYIGINPRLGLVWDLADDVQVYANASRSFEPPNSLSFHTIDGTLDAQRATTLEVGTRGGDHMLSWDIAGYYGWLRNELLEAPVPGNPALPPRASNAGRTRHMGLELGLQGEQPLSSLSGKLRWSVTYTWNAFRFHDDPLYGNNRLPSVPPHVARAALVYHHRSGFYAGPQVEMASSWQIDQANTLKAPGYAIWNLTAGYEPPGGDYRLFVDVRNVADKRYAATTDYLTDARRQSTEVFNPGLARAVFAGIELAW